MSPVAQGASAELAGDLGAGGERRAVVSAAAALLERNVFTACVLVALAAVQAQIIRHSIVADSWYALVSGRLIWHHGLPHTDTLTTLTLGHRWVDQQWLAQLVLYGLWSAGGWSLAAVADVLLFIGAFAIAATAARRSGVSDRSAAIVTVGCLCVALSNGAVRAQILAYPLFAAVLALLLADARAPGRRVLLVFPLLVLWANMHGSVVVGAALAALYGLTEAARSWRRPALRRRAAALIVLPWPCTLVSPYAWHLPAYYRSVLDNSTLTQVVSEWAPSNIRTDPVFFALLLVGLWLASSRRATLTPFTQLVLWGTAVLGLLAIRNQVWFAIAAAATLPSALDGAWRPRPAARRQSLNVALVAAGAAAVLVSLGVLAARGDGWFEHDYPPAAAAAVAGAATQPGVRVFANEQYADWLLWMDPALAGRVAYDARFELLAGRQLRTIAFFRAEHGLDWRRAAAGYRVLVLSVAGDAGAVRAYARLPGSRVLYRGRGVAVIERPS